MVTEALAARLYSEAGAARWEVDAPAFAAALEASLAKAFATRAADRDECQAYLSGLHLADLALACALAAGHDGAWQHLIATYRPVLQRAADALAPDGSARELADALFAELFGVHGASSRVSLFRYFHGRSSLATWLRAVLAQRHVDRIRSGRRILPLDEQTEPPAGPRRLETVGPEHPRFLRLMQAALAAALGTLTVTDRFRVACYYAQQMTLAQIGRLLGEHEATVSRHLARTRRELRSGIERHLVDALHLPESAVEECFRSVAADSGSLDLNRLLSSAPQDGEDRKDAVAQRSKGEVT